MQNTEIHRQIVTVLFDASKLPVPKGAKVCLDKFNGTFPRHNGKLCCRGNVCFFLLDCFKPLHEDAVVEYLEKARGWPLERLQEAFVRLDVDTQVHLALAKNQRGVFDFYEAWLEQLQKELVVSPLVQANA